MTAAEVLTESDLADFRIFEGMSAQDRTDLLERMEIHKYEPNERILREGLEIQILWVIVKGHCAVNKTIGKETKEGQSRTFAGE